MKLSENVTIAISVAVVVGIFIAGSAITRAENMEGTAGSSVSEQSETENGNNPENAKDTTDSDSSFTAEAGDSVAISSLLMELTISDEKNADSYDREAFNHWISAEGSKCNVRHAVLKEESNPPLPADAPCPFDSGKWQSLYDGVLITDPGKLDIDHMVPLKEAWRSGAYAWDEDKRERYANDREDARSLIAVSAKSNRSKSDRDPSDWLPPDESYLCEYIADWVSVKYRWKLTLQQSEFDTINDIATECSNELIVPVQVD